VFLRIPGVNHQAVKEGGDERKNFGELLQQLVESTCGGVKFLVLLAFGSLLQSNAPVVLCKFKSGEPVTPKAGGEVKSFQESDQGKGFSWWLLGGHSEILYYLVCSI
jgi:hypothetical protein